MPPLKTPSALSVFSTHRKDSSTEPTAIALITGFDKRRPNRPFTAKPAAEERNEPKLHL